MAEQESAEVRNANKLFRREEQAKEGAAAWKEYLEQRDVARLKTAKLRAQRLARDAAARDAASQSEVFSTKSVATARSAKR
jgi:polynucleotide 5'-kinase involved in rRNA processing